MSLAYRLLNIAIEFKNEIITHEQFMIESREAIKEAMPKWKPAYTYGSKNADIYIAFDAGFKVCLSEMLKILEGR